MDRRRMLIAPSGGLPSAYQEVEWIANDDGKAYINTGYVPKVSPCIESDVMMLEAADKDLWGFVNNTTPSFILNLAPGGSNFDVVGLYVRYYGTGNAWSGTIIHTWRNTFVHIKHSNEFQFGTYTGTTKAVQSFANNAQSLMLFRARNIFKLKLKTTTIKDGDTVVRVMIPCYRKSDNVIGMFDTVGKVFYTNAASNGAFTCGSDVN